MHVRHPSSTSSKRRGQPKLTTVRFTHGASSNMHRYGTATNHSSTPEMAMHCRSAKLRRARNSPVKFGDMPPDDFRNSQHGMIKDRMLVVEADESHASGPRPPPSPSRSMLSGCGTSASGVR
mmetsp:Transcript_36413/g.106546  ORF Transcript_36413/g.106546 Transcript_36413/m.106546 type:complete len:122 (+) Transcript_36413:144-509(+)